MSAAICGAEPAAIAAPGCRFAHPGYRHTSSPPFLVRPGAAGRLLPSSARKGVRNDRAKNRARGARMFWHAGSPHAVSRRHTGSGPAQQDLELNRALEAVLRLRSARDGFFGLLHVPRGRHWRRLRPVRASCRPDITWTVRPCCRRLFLPSSGPYLLASKDRHRGEPPHPAPRIEDGSNAPLIGAGRVKNIPRDWENQFLKTRKWQKPVQGSVEGCGSL